MSTQDNTAVVIQAKGEHLPKPLKHEQSYLESLLKKKFFALIFPKQIELEFLQYYQTRFINQLRVAMMIGLVAVIGFHAAEYWFLNEQQELLLLERDFLLAPILLFGSIFILSNRYPKTHQLFLSSFTLVFGASLVYMLQMVPSELDVLYFSGIFLLVAYSLTLSRMRFWYATGTSIGLALIYSICMAFLEMAEMREMQIFGFGYLLAIVICLATNYLMERGVRFHYLQARLLVIKSETLKLMNQELKNIASIDGLTQIANRRTFDQHIETEWSRGQRLETPLSLLLIDIDYFKQFNDTYGHQRGDACLVKLASIFSTFTRRPGDLVARYGGEEFVLLLPATEQEHAVQVANMLKTAVEKLNIQHEKSKEYGKVTISIGLSCLIPTKETSIRDLIQLADEALYSAKNGGRNQVVSA